jgi:hypothetical protein
LLDLDNKYTKRDVDNIRRIALEVWGANVNIDEIKPTSAPFPEFDWPMQLYGCIDIRLIYERAHLGADIMVKGVYVNILELTDTYIIGFDSTIPENILSNFKLLDEVVKGILEKRL